MHRFDSPPPWHPMNYGVDWGHVVLLSGLSTLFWLALSVGIAWIVMRWLLSSKQFRLADLFGVGGENPSSLEILRQRYAAGEIDATTFEQMRERLEASYQQGDESIPSTEEQQHSS